VSADDSALIARVVASDDRVAFNELVQRHQSAVRQFLRSLTQGDVALSDDLAQETFLQAYRALARFRTESSFTTWLLGIAHNYWRNARRRQRTIPLEPAHLEAHATEPSAARTIDLQHDLAQALGQLTPDEQTAMHLCYQQGLSHREIADVVGWPIGTVKTHLARSKDKLRPLLASWNPQT
jgi:RNA polymerase sigma-70 factor (ECF subfamily)